MVVSTSKNRRQGLNNGSKHLYFETDQKKDKAFVITIIILLLTQFGSLHKEGELHAYMEHKDIKHSCQKIMWLGRDVTKAFIDTIFFDR